MAGLFFTPFFLSTRIFRTFLAHKTFSITIFSRTFFLKYVPGTGFGHQTMEHFLLVEGVRRRLISLLFATVLPLSFFFSTPFCRTFSSWRDILSPQIIKQDAGPTLLLVFLLKSTVRLRRGYTKYPVAVLLCHFPVAWGCTLLFCCIIFSQHAFSAAWVL